MIIVIKSGTSKDKIELLKKELESAYDVSVNEWVGTGSTVLGLIGDTHHVDLSSVEAQPIVESVKRVQEPYKKANRKFHPDDTIIDVAGRKIGTGNLTLIAGPCSVESEEQIIGIAKRVKQSGANFLRGGAFKPRTSPYSFQGLRAEGLDLPLFENVDIIQVGARNMQNFELLKELGHCGKPVLLKRGLSSTIEETLMSAEYIMSGGNDNVILCERGIRTFEPSVRNTLDISAIPIFKRRSHLPVIVDPSHAAGIPWLIEPLAMASLAAGADGIIIEVHNDPAHALSDGAQSLTPDQFDPIAKRLIKAFNDGIQVHVSNSDI